MNPETTRKAPRTAAAAYNGHDYLLKECRTLEIETQELAEALAPFAQIGDIVNDDDCTLWKRSVSAGSVRKARAALARHRANQEVKP